MQSDIIIIGGGASGLMAAIAAALHGATVVIIEHKNRVGQKILVTGNGKCNLSNSNQDHGNYRGEHPEIAQEVLKHFGVAQTIELFNFLGLLVKEKQGYYYPLCEQASTVLDVLRWKCEELKVQFLCNTTVSDIKKKKNSFTIEILNETGSNASLSCSKLILATGGKANAKTGSDGSGYALASKLGHTIITPTPALTGLFCQENFFKELAGVRTQAKVSLWINNKEEIAEDGELQLTNYGISGIPVFQISRFASKALLNKQNVKVIIDFLPKHDYHIIENFISMQIKNSPNKKMEQNLFGLLNKKIATTILKLVKIKPTTKASELTQTQIKQLLDKIKSFEVLVKQVNSFENAQVCAGGVDLTQVFSESLESRIVPNLYIIGELLDIDGACGGYNLQWAWTTGYLAGQKAADNMLQK